MKTIPVIDIFAGPGGLGEGFSSCATHDARFDVRRSFEADQIACETLRVRAFFHLAKGKSALSSYYDHLRGKLRWEEFRGLHPDIWQLADERVHEIELGNPTTRSFVHQEIRTETRDKDFVLIGGPPCQAYSIVGRSRRLGVGGGPEPARIRKVLAAEFYKDPRHSLYREYLEILAIHRPIAFIMENVRGLTSARTGTDDANGGMFDIIRSDLREPLKAVRPRLPDSLLAEIGLPQNTKYKLFTLTGYRATTGNVPRKAADFVVKSELYGIPQARHRIIILGLREDVTKIPGTLTESPSVSAREVLRDLPQLRSTVSRSDVDWFSAIESETWRIPESVQTKLDISKALRRLRHSGGRLSTGGRWIPTERFSAAPDNLTMQWVADQRLGGTVQHESRSHMPSDLVRYLYCALFAEKYGRSPSIEEWPAPLRPAHKNIKNFWGRLSATGFSDRFKVQGLNGSNNTGRPSSTVTSHIAKDGHYYIHFDPAQCRSLTVREAARLQTFPDNYFFRGNRTQQYHQVGNAVPPLLAKQIASIVMEVLMS